jgi:DDE family transposase
MTAHGSGLGSQRWVVERTLSWVRQYRRLRVRYERTAEIHEAFLCLACSLICLRTLREGHFVSRSLLFREQPWRIVQEDLALLGSNLGDVVDADQ